jgi:phosphopantothenoylcysteine decarboxylase/phosphopantothenate--cysteine ligase
MAQAVKDALPADIAVMVAAVADWYVEPAVHKLKKSSGPPPALKLERNPDILAMVAAGPMRPALVVGFAAETETMISNAQEKLRTKGCDWIIANDVAGGVMGGANNRIHLITRDGVESWPEQSKEAVGQQIATRIAEALAAMPDVFGARI